MYFDAIVDSAGDPVFNGTPDEVRKFIETNRPSDQHFVHVGQTLLVLTLDEYLAQSAPKKEDPNMIEFEMRLTILDRLNGELRRLVKRDSLPGVPNQGDAYTVDPDGDTSAEIMHILWGVKTFPPIVILRPLVVETDESFSYIMKQIDEGHWKAQ